jgi:hypothetical protein
LVNENVIPVTHVSLVVIVTAVNMFAASVPWLSDILSLKLPVTTIPLSTVVAVDTTEISPEGFQAIVPYLALC